MFVDLKAPRFNPRKFRKQIVTEELHRDWKKKTGRKESFTRFKEIWDAIATELMDSVIEEQDGVRLLGIGDIYMGYIPKMRKSPDHKLSNQLGKRVYHENWHSNGRAGKLIFGTRRRPYMFSKYYLWAFNTARDFQRKVAQAFINNPERYKNSLERFPKIPYDLYTKFNDSSRSNITGEDRTEAS